MVACSDISCVPHPNTHPHGAVHSVCSIILFLNMVLLVKGQIQTSQNFVWVFLARAVLFCRGNCRSFFTCHAEVFFSLNIATESNCCLNMMALTKVTLKGMLTNTDSEALLLAVSGTLQ